MLEIVHEVIEIREDAYKQNEVYRPWPAEADAEQSEKPQLRAVKNHPVKGGVSPTSPARPQ